MLHPQPFLSPKDKDALIQALKAGLSPERGLQNIQVGREKELQSLKKDLARVKAGGSSFRLLIGDFGAGKSFLLQLLRQRALQEGLVTMHADLSPERRLHATSGQAQNLYVALMKSMATSLRPMGNAMESVLQHFFQDLQRKAKKSKKLMPFLVHESLSSLLELPGGHDFIHVLASYGKAIESQNPILKAHALRWLHGECKSLSQAKSTLSVHAYIHDGNTYESLKVMSRFLRLAGYDGLFICLDELVNLYKLRSPGGRQANYEQILHILNDCLQAEGESLGFLLAGSPEFLLDERKGLYSYQALRSRLKENSFAERHGLSDYDSPTLFLKNLDKKELFALLQNIRNLYASPKERPLRMPDGGIQAFLTHCEEVIGEAYFKTPRSSITSFVGLLSLLYQDKGLHWRQLLGELDIQEARSEGPSDIPFDHHNDYLSHFQL